MRPAVKYVVLTLLWSGVAVYLLWIAGAAGADRASWKISALQIAIADSSAQGQLVASPEVRKWLQHSEIETLGATAGTIDLTAIEQLIARNGFVGDVAAYVTRGGVLHIDIEPRQPLLRLLTDGENGYVTAQGFVFAAPQASSLYVPVVTGSYRPPFPAGYTGDIRTHTEEELARIDHEIEQLEVEKLPIIRTEREDARNFRKEAAERVSWWWKYIDRDYDERVQMLRDKKQQKRRAYRYRSRMRQQQLDQIAARQEQKRDQQKKLEKNYEDFMKLLTFVRLIEKDDFWGAEVVQIVVRTAPSGAMEVDLIPRSGRHVIRFGRLERTSEKLDKLMRFYRKGLSKIGWGTYRVIDVRYADQVICR